jgi:hypothetical protein
MKGTSMETIVVQRHIVAAPEQVFNWCADSTNYERTVWVLRDTLTKPGHGARYGVGAIRVHTWLVGRFHERITGYDARDRSTTSWTRASRRPGTTVAQ